MKRLVTFAALALTACPPQLDPHGTICNADPDCATGLVCIANICSDPVVGGGAGGGSTDAGGTGGGSATGGGSGGGGGGGGAVTLVVRSVMATVGTGGPCSDGDGSKTFRSDGGEVQCADTPFCNPDGGPIALPWSPSLLEVGQVVGEPLPDVVIVEGSTLHVLENLGGGVFVERPSAPLGVNGFRGQPVCLAFPSAQRAVVVAGLGPDGGTFPDDGGFTRDGGNGVLVSCNVFPFNPPACAPLLSDVVDFTAGGFPGGGFDGLVVGTSHTVVEYDSHLSPLSGLESPSAVEVIGDVGVRPDGGGFYTAFEGIDVDTFNTDDNDLSGADGLVESSQPKLALVSLSGQQAIVVAYKGGFAMSDGFRFYDLDDDANVSQGVFAPGTVEVERMIAGDFSLSASTTGSRSALLTITPGEVDRWAIVNDGGMLGAPVMETLFSFPATDLALGDLDGDGVADLAIASTVGPSLVILKGR